MASYKLIVKNAKVILKTVTNSVLNITGIKDLLTGSGSVDSNTKIDWTLQHYTNTAANFTSINPILLVGQVGIETDDLLTAPKYKIGDGLTAWNTLPYNSSGGSGLSGLTTNKVLKATSSTTAGDSNITDDGITVTVASPNGVNKVEVSDYLVKMYYESVINGLRGYVESDDVKSKIFHDLLIQLNATSVTKNGVEVATVNDIPSLLHKINTPIAHTGTTTATVIHSYEIPAGSLASNDFLKFSLRHLSTNNANNKTVKIWANTSNTIAGATQLATYTYTTNSGGVFWFRRTMFFQNSLSSQKIINTSISHANDEVSYPNNGDPSLTLNFANSVWILIEVTLANAADTFTLNAYMNKIER